MIVIRNQALRKTLGLLTPFLLIPAVVFAGALLIDARQYLPVSLLVAALSLVLFLCGFEQKKTGSRRLVLVALTVALSVVSRFIPFVKPVTALTVLTGVALGGEAGFLVGSLSAFLSNFAFGQGPWTPFQMMAWGMIGLFAGFLADPLRRSRVLLILYGFLSGVAYSLFMDVWTTLWYSGTFDGGAYLAFIVSALPYTALYAVSGGLFLFLFGRQYLTKMERIKLKYGV